MDDLSKQIFDELLGHAKAGRWPMVDAHLLDQEITREWMHWAIWTGIVDDDDNVRDFAATILVVSSLEMGEMERARMRAYMQDDDYHIVRYRLAMALYKRGERYPETVEKMEEAAKDPDVGALAQGYLKAT